MRTNTAVGAEKFVMKNRIGPVTPDRGKVLFQWLRDLLLFHPNPYGFDCTTYAYCYIPPWCLGYTAPLRHGPRQSDSTCRSKASTSQMSAGAIMPTRSARDFLFRAMSWTTLVSKLVRFGCRRCSELPTKG